jgi:NAD(P)-dependent dehydrogenase (short-subunit alcohol dehydrogenase family)
MRSPPRVVITGAARGIGRAIGIAWGAQGAHVVLAARSTDAMPSKALPGTLEDAAQAVESVGGVATIVRADLSTEDGVRNVVATVDELDGCDVLVNNAAVSFVGDFLDVPTRRWSVVAAVNLLAPVALIHALLPSMLDRGGTIINLSSGAAQDDAVPQLPYGCTKLALERLTVGLHHQFLGRGVAFHCIRIDELVPTEAVSYSLGDTVLDVPVCDVNSFAAATVRLAGEPELSGEVLTHARLRELGLLE